MTEEIEVAPETAATEEAVQSEVIEQDTEAPEAAESTEGQPEQEQPADGDAKAKAEAEASDERKSRNQRRKEAFRQAVEDKKKAEAEARELAQEAENLRKAIGALPEPTFEQFGGDFEKYQAALSAYSMMKGMDERDLRKLEGIARERMTKVEAAKKAEAEFVNQSWVDHFEDGRSKYPDFEAKVTAPNVPITESMMRMLAESDHAADVAYYLATNPVTAGQIAAMDPIAQARALGRLEAQASAPKPKKVSTAPDPVSPVSGKSSPQKKVSDMSPEEFDAWRAAGGTFTL